MSETTYNELEGEVDEFLLDRDIYKVGWKWDENDPWHTWDRYNIATYQGDLESKDRKEPWRLFSESIKEGDILIAQSGEGTRYFTFGIGIASRGYDSENSKIVDVKGLDLFHQIPVRWETVKSNGEGLGKGHPVESPSGVVAAVDKESFKHLLNGLEQELQYSFIDSLLQSLYEISVLNNVDVIIDKYIPPEWKSTRVRKQQIETVVGKFLTVTDEDDETSERWQNAQGLVTGKAKADINIVESKWGREIWDSPTKDEGYLRGRLDFALENIESDFKEKVARLDVTWTDPRDVFQDTEGTASLDELFFPDGIVGDRPLTAQIDDALRNGKHIILIGPPGSGKTKIAQMISEHYVGDDYTLTTATDDWSTFDTIGGYRPSQNRDGSLEFAPGIFLQRFLDPSQMAEPKNEWLIIDELNRADIDKAFGSLFSVLTGNTVTLPFENDNGPIVLVGDPTSEEKRPLTSRHYYVPASWRLISTMNTDDKASLYKMSYAFMRRFAFISVPAPDYSDIDSELVANYADLWGFDFEENIFEDITEIWRAIQDHRVIGPALIKDILSQIQSQADSEKVEYAYAVRMYVVPQLEGLTKDEINGMIDRINYNVDNFDRDLVKQFAEDYLGISLQE